MSYTLRDLLLDVLPEGALEPLTDDEKFPDGLDNLIDRILEFARERILEPRLWVLVENFARDHEPPEGEPWPDYVRGFYNGLVAAAREGRDDLRVLH